MLRFLARSVVWDNADIDQRLLAIVLGHDTFKLSVF